AIALSARILANRLAVWYFVAERSAPDRVASAALIGSAACPGETPTASTAASMDLPARRGIVHHACFATALRRTTAELSHARRRRATGCASATTTLAGLAG